MSEYKKKRTLVKYPEGRKNEEYRVPDEVENIGDFAFMNCLLKSVVILDNVKTIGRSAFESCRFLEEVVLPSTVETLLFGTFQGCESLKSIIIPEGFKEIDRYVFYDCAELTNVSIPASVTSIERNAFSCCPKLALNIHPNNPRYQCVNGVLSDNQQGNVSVLGEEDVSNDPFSGKSDDVFVIPNRVKKVDKSSFVKFKDGHKIIRIPASVEKIEIDALLRLPHILEIQVDSDNQRYSSKDGALFDKKTSTLVLCPRRNEYKVPDDIQD